MLSSSSFIHFHDISGILLGFTTCMFRIGRLGAWGILWKNVNVVFAPMLSSPSKCQCLIFLLDCLLHDGTCFVHHFVHLRCWTIPSRSRLPWSSHDLAGLRFDEPVSSPNRVRRSILFERFHAVRVCLADHGRLAAGHVRGIIGRVDRSPSQAAKALIVKIFQIFFRPQTFQKLYCAFVPDARYRVPAVLRFMKIWNGHGLRKAHLFSCSTRNFCREIYQIWMGNIRKNHK